MSENLEHQAAPTNIETGNVLVPPKEEKQSAKNLLGDLEEQLKSDELVNIEPFDKDLFNDFLRTAKPKISDEIIINGKSYKYLSGYPDFGVEVSTEEMSFGIPKRKFLKIGEIKTIEHNGVTYKWEAMTEKDIEQRKRIIRELGARGLYISANPKIKIRTITSSDGQRSQTWETDPGNHCANFQFDKGNIKFEEMKNDNTRAYIVEFKKADGEYVVLQNGKDFGRLIRAPETGAESAESAEKVIRELMNKYETLGWVSQNVMWQGEVGKNRIAVSQPVRGQNPIFEYRDGMFYPVNYPGSFRPMNPQGFDEFVKTTEHRRGVEKKEKAEVSTEAIKKLKELGFTLQGMHFYVDGLKNVGFDFDDNTKNLIYSIDNNGVTIRIENKVGPDDILEISANSIKANGKEMPLDAQGNTLRDLIWVDEGIGKEQIQDNIKFNPYVSGVTAGGEKVEILEADYRSAGIEWPGYEQSFKVTIDGKLMKIVRAGRVRDGGTTDIEGFIPVEVAGRKLKAMRRIHIPAFRKGDTEIDGERFKT